MKRLALSAILFLLLISSLSNYSIAAASGPDETVRKFYSWYLHSLNKGDENPLKNRTVSLQYLTPEFLRRVPRLTRQLDADVIICAQDFDQAWEKNFKVESPTLKGNRATVLIQLDGPAADRVKLKVTLKRTAAGWRIDGVACGS